MKFVVLKDFTDSVDKKVLREGKLFPHAESEYELTDERIVRLLTADNKHNEPLIAVSMKNKKEELEHVAALLEVELDPEAKKEDIIQALEGA